jgi:hypothetical protein
VLVALAHREVRQQRCVLRAAQLRSNPLAEPVPVAEGESPRDSERRNAELANLRRPIRKYGHEVRADGQVSRDYLASEHVPGLRWHEPPVLGGRQDRLLDAASMQDDPPQTLPTE